MSSGLASTNGSSLTLNGYITTCETGTPPFAGSIAGAGYEFLYFIQPDGGGPVKIGRAVHPEKRRTSLQSAHWQDLRILALVRTSCPAADERALHQLLGEHRLRGEWFSPVDDVRLLVHHAHRLESSGLASTYAGEGETDARIEWFAETARWVISFARRLEA